MRGLSSATGSSGTSSCGRAKPPSGLQRFKGHNLSFTSLFDAEVTADLGVFQLLLLLDGQFRLL